MLSLSSPLMVPCPLDRSSPLTTSGLEMPRRERSLMREKRMSRRRKRESTAEKRRRWEQGERKMNLRRWMRSPAADGEQDREVK